jgi:hypothetical protein
LKVDRWIIQLMGGKKMGNNATGEQQLIERLKLYEEVCNRYDLDAAVAMFTEGGCIEALGKEYCGKEVLRAAHEYDLGCRAQVGFSDFSVEGDIMRCRFTYCDEVDRVTGTGGTVSGAEFTFRDGLIERFVSLPPDEEERQRVRQAKAPFFAWARENYPEEVARGFTFDYESGYSLYMVARAWLDARQRPTSDT